MAGTKRYGIGIDLGTTNCAMSYWDSLDPEAGLQVFSLLQWHDSSQSVERSTLPSFTYALPKALVKKGSMQLPHEESGSVTHVVGEMAKNMASGEPGRVIHAAKSWLCHGGVDRRQPILPWHSEELLGDKRLSPVSVSAGYLRHLKEQWDYRMARHTEAYKFEHQQIVVTEGNNPITF